MAKNKQSNIEAKIPEKLGPLILLGFFFARNGWHLTCGLKSERGAANQDR